MRRLKIVFYASDKPREIMLAKALAVGADRHGDTVEIRRTGEYGETDTGDDLRYPGPTPDTDVAVAFGVKGKSRQILDDHLAVGKSTLFFDKGYSRQSGEGGHTEYSRISVNGSDPLQYLLQEQRQSDRFNKLGVQPKPRRGSNGMILLCGSSEKYHAFHKLEHPSVDAERIVRRLRKQTERHIIYRPKPSWKNAKPIPGTSFSGGNQSIQDALRSCHCLVTHGSAAAMDAVLAGVPAIVLGNSIARPVAETLLENVEHPFWPDEELRRRWCYAMAYCQWRTEELRTGEAWSELKREIVRQGRL